MINLAFSYSDLGRTEQEAMDLREKTLEATQRTLGSEHPDTLGAMYNLALSYSSPGRLQEVNELSKKALEARQRILGPEHPDTLLSMELVAYCNNKLSKPTEFDQQAGKLSILRTGGLFVVPLKHSGFLTIPE
ncbi:hypothetical protein Egran_01023 [Elaphomyces granulatus]|uniref:Kinesin light chain n=1 Tax=Elaphomyces granulatus TaxID=519963 RepID=A0A232M4F5_9EURO|nr:hypothetical protein Egran_01023 [Elaphomyces granulatus]